MGKHDHPARGARCLEKTPNQSLEPMARSVTPRAGARVAPALAMAHHLALGILNKCGHSEKVTYNLVPFKRRDYYRAAPRITQAVCLERRRCASCICGLH